MRQPGDSSQKNFGSKRASVKLLLAGAACVSSLGLAIGAAGAAGAASAPPSVSTGAVSSVTPTSVIVAGVVNPHGTHTDWYFEYGPNTTFIARTPVHSAGSGIVGVSVSEKINGLSVSSGYDYRIVAYNAAGTTFGASGSFNTTSAPVVATGAAAAITAHTATLEATINSEALTTDWYFQYGTTTKYGGKTATKAVVAGPNAVAVAEPVIGLAAQSTYHFRIVGINRAGTTYGADSAFSTGLAVTLNASVPSITYGGSLMLSGNTTNGVANKQVTIESEAFNQTAFTGIATVVTGAGGAWSLSVNPSVRTSYQAVISGGTSSVVVVGVSPVVTIRKLSRGRIMTSVLGAISFAGHVLQLQILSQNNWVTWKHVLLNTDGKAVFTTRLPLAVHTGRMAIAPFVAGIDQAAPGYLAGYSNAIRIS